MIYASLELPGRGLTPEQAWAELKAGNDRMVHGSPLHPRREQEAREALVSGQRPIAAFIGCSDSRVPLEIAFDAGYGDIFAVRTAGPTLGQVTVGSLEFAVVELEVPLVVVLTHQHCGAIKTARHHATIGADSRDELPGSLPVLIAGIRRTTALTEPMEDAPAAHARDTVELLKESSKPIREALAAGKVGVVAAVYSLDTGAVTEVH